MSSAQKGCTPSTSSTSTRSASPGRSWPTLRRVFDHVALAADAYTLSGQGGGNLVAIASDSPIDKRAIDRGFEKQQVAWDVIDGDRLTKWIDGAAVLTDDYAPVDQLLTPQPAA